MSNLFTHSKTALIAAESAPCILWLMDSLGRCIYLNNRWYEYTGSDRECLSWEGYFKDHESFFSLAKLESQGYFSATIQIKNNDGEYRSFLATGKNLGDRITGAFIESGIEELERSIQPYYKTFAEAMPDMAFIANAHGDIIYYNQRWYEFVAGMKNTEGWGWSERPIHHPDDLERTILRWKHSLKTGAPYEIEYRLRRYDGTYVWHLGRALPVKDDKEKVNLWIGTNTDIHRQKMAEVEKDKLNQKLRKNHRSLKQVNELHRDLLHLIPHDLRNPLSSMVLSLELLKTEENSAKRLELIEGMSEMIKKQEEIMDGLSAMVEIESLQDLKVEEIDLSEMTKDLIEHFANKIESTQCEIELEISGLHRFTFVKAMLWSILVNLLSNALKYRSNDRKPKVKIRAERNSEFIFVSVADNGLGMDLQKAGNPFDPFKRLTSRGQGKGVGLYLVKRLIEKNGGKIEVESTPGEGTKFTCCLKPYG